MHHQPPHTKALGTETTATQIRTELVKLVHIYICFHLEAEQHADFPRDVWAVGEVDGAQLWAVILVSPVPKHPQRAFQTGVATQCKNLHTH